MLKKTVFIMLVLALYLVIPASDAGNDLHKAAGIGDIKTAAQAISVNPKAINALNEEGFTPLHYAAKNKHRDIVAILLKSGADVSIPTVKDKRYPLHLAASAGDLEITKMLVEAGADINSREIDDETPLYYAAYPGHLDIVRYLLDKGASLKGEYTKINTSPLAYAISNGKSDVAKLLIERGADVVIDHPDGFTYMHRAAFSADETVIALLAKKGLDVNAQLIEQKQTPLYGAAGHGNIAAAKALISLGAKVNSANADGRTPLFIAAYFSQLPIINLLAENGADINTRESIYGYTPLHAAALKGDTKTVKFLLSKGADVNTGDNLQRTPLQLAARYGFMETAKLLKMSGSKADKLDKNFGPSPLLKKELKPGQAFIWYLGHSGWALKTQKNLIIIDFFEPDKLPVEPLLANGRISPEELKDLKVMVLASHFHGDHYSPAIFEWKKAIPQITYVMGFTPKDIDKNLYTAINPREQKVIDGVKITAINSTDSGVGFFIQADGLSLFHPGDHADRGKEFSKAFTAEIDFLASQNLQADLMFAPVSGCGFGDLCSVRNGAFYTAQKLNPKVIFPMHALNNEHVFQKFASEAKEKKISTFMGMAKHRGDHFVFVDNTLKTL